MSVTTADTITNSDTVLESVARSHSPTLACTDNSSLVLTFCRTNIIADTETIFGPVALSVRDANDCFAVVLSVAGPDDSRTIAAGA